MVLHHQLGAHQFKQFFLTETLTTVDSWSLSLDTN